MSDNDAMKKLLYAILKQKCLKDVDWNKVAADHVLTTNGQPDITNGHAARMRYSRFKKQMEGGNAPSGRRPRAAPTSPRKSREKGVKKDSPSKRVKIEGRIPSSGSGIGVKSEPGGEMNEGLNVAASFSTSASLAGDRHESGQGASERRQSSILYPQRAEDEIRIKHEPCYRTSNNHNSNASYVRANSVLMMPTPNPSTPRYSPSPSPSEQANHSFQTSMGDLELMGSFGMPDFSPVTAEYLTRAGEAHGHMHDHEQSFHHGGYEAGVGGSQEYGSLLSGMGMGLGLGEEGYGMWSSGLGAMGAGDHGEGGRGYKEHREMAGGDVNASENGDVLVKTEERWEDAYHRG